MRLLLVIVLAAAVVFAFAGCNESKEMTEATKVENPKEKAPETQAAAPKAEEPKPEPKAEEAKVEAPKPDKDGWVKTESGLKYKDKKVGKGTAVKKGDTVVVHYKGWLDNGTVFDTSKKEGREPFSFPVGAGRVIPGWDEGLQGMKIGGVRELNIPSELGYGARGAGGTIPPNATLHFDVELLEIQ